MVSRLYTLADLLHGYDRARPGTFVRSMDFRTLRKFMANGGPAPSTRTAMLAQARHDANIGWALREHIAALKPRMVAVMGGHGLARDSAPYLTTADLSRALTRRGYLIVTGGGPGAMEAAHFGAYFAHAPDRVYGAAKAALAANPQLPDELEQLFDRTTGEFQTGRTDLIWASAAWQDAALRARDLLDGTPAGESIAMPTWVYASEPTNVFATAYAKYYQDSIREETLVAEGKAGALYARGGGGTLREIFQGVEYNYYIAEEARFQPMIFADPDDYWRTDPSYGPDGKPIVPGVNLERVIAPILRLPLAGRDWWRACQPQIRFTTDVDEIDQLLQKHAAVAQSRLCATLKGEIPMFPTKR